MNRYPLPILLLAALLLPMEGPADELNANVLIQNVIIVDGTGAPGRPGAVRLRDGRIVETGDLQPAQAETVVDGGGHVLAPGFIDTHSHADIDLQAHPDALAHVSQGITTAIIGQDGRSTVPLGSIIDEYARSPAALNLASYAGHGTIRVQVMGEDFRREATGEEVARMAEILRREMEQGALGLGTGLEYDPGIYSSRDEVIELARVAAAYGGRYISHIRSEDRWFSESVDEIIEIGRVTGIPVQISHIKLALVSLWGRADEFIARMDAARAEGIEISADIYPYPYWQSLMMVMLPGRDINDRAEVEFALTELAPPEGIWFSRFDPRPELVGKTLIEAAEMLGTDPVTAFMTLIAESEAMKKQMGPENYTDMIIATSMDEADIRKLMAWEHSNICSDGGLVDLHPRGSGSFPRVLGRYSREAGVFPIEMAVHKMTGLSARHMGLKDRGEIRPGAAADLVLLDPATVIDNATPQNPQALSTGILSVWVNGEVVFLDGRSTGARPGVFIKRAPTASRSHRP